MELRTDYSNVSFQNNGKLKLLIIVGTRPEIIRLAAVINKTRQYFDVILAHTGQNYDYNLNGVFFKDLNLKEPEVYMDVVGDDLGSTCGNIINASYKLMVATKPDAVLVLGDTNSCLSVIGAKRLHIPIFHMEAGNRCKDECLPEETNRRIVDIISDVNLAYSEHARRYLAECGLLESALMLQAHRWQRYYIRTLPRLKHLMFTSVLDWKRANTFSSLLTVKRILTPRKTFSRSSTLLILWQRNMICLSSTVATHVRAIALQLRASSLTHVYRYSNLLASMTTTASR